MLGRVWLVSPSAPLSDAPPGVGAGPAGPPSGAAAEAMRPQPILPRRSLPYDWPRRLLPH